MIKTEVTYTCDMGDETVAVMDSEASLPQGWQMLTLNVPAKPTQQFLVCPFHPGETFMVIAQTPEVVLPGPIPAPVELPPEIPAPARLMGL